LMESDKLTGKLARWALILQEYDFQVVHRPGVTNLNADGLSRNPCTSQKDTTGARWHGEVDEEMVPGWHASAFLCWLSEASSSEGHLTSCAGQSGDGQSVDPDVQEEDTDQQDVHVDAQVMAFLRTGEVPSTVGAKERDRVLQRAKRYRLEGRHVLRVWKDGKVRVVPPPARRVPLVRHAHEELGHFGVKRTYSLLRGQYWWRGMHAQVQQLVARCMVCDRVRASFNAPTPHLHPLPIMGLGYRWSVDFAGPLPLTVRHHRYVLVMVEHFSKWIELVALPDKGSEGAAYAFLDRVLSHFGAPAEVLSDQGPEFRGEFQDLCDKSLIDHRTTSRDHPEADGLAERVVQTVKKALRKYGLQRGHLGDWDIQLPWLAMGYRFSRQASLASFSPYFLLYGRDPDLPAAIRRDTHEVVNLDDPDVWVTVCSQRAELFRRVMPAAFENLAIAQHRDTLRYAKIRGGGYRPSVRRFHVGDFVYLQQTAPTTLDVTAGRTILRVREVLSSGVLMLEGRDGVVWKDHVRNCAPCHLPNVDGVVDPSSARISAGLRCRLCGSAGDAAHMLLCDVCSTGWHMSCLTPALTVVPTGQWRCPQCT
jgi:hypothetical protein